MEPCYPRADGVPMRIHVANGARPPAAKCWSRARARIICPRCHLRVLPTRTRPSLFASD